MSKDSKVTISTIADILGVSAISVSRALASQPGVSDELRKKIVTKAKELGYKKGKATGKYSILVLIGRRFIAENGQFSLMVQEIETQIKQADAEFTLEFMEKEKQDELVLPYNLSRGNRFDGVIMLGQFADTYAYYIKQIIEHVVFLNGSSDMVDCDSVQFNHNKNGYRAVEHFVEMGHRRIGLVGVEGTYNNCQRFLGFYRSLEQQGLQFHSDHIIDKREQINHVIPALIKAGNLPTAFVCQSDTTALRLIKVLHEADIRVPDDVSVIGSGNNEMASLCIPTLTTFDLNIAYASQVAVTTMLNRIQHPNCPYTMIEVDSVLVKRDSVCQNHEEGVLPLEAL